MTGVHVEELRAARARRRALIGFNVYNLEQALGVARAAERAGVAVLLQAGSSAFRYAGRQALARLALGVAADSPARIGVHLDHSTDVREIRECLELGYTSVMYDGSALALADNIAATREVVALAHAHGAWVEAELAGIGGDEDRSAAAAGTARTDPDVAAEFVASTNVDALAVAIGNVHGVTGAPVTLDLELLDWIAAAVPAPLVLHGASGITDDVVHQAIQRGVAKLNVNTELRHALRESLQAPRAHDDSVAVLLGHTIEATAAGAKLRAFSGAPS